MVYNFPFCVILFPPWYKVHLCIPMRCFVLRYFLTQYNFLLCAISYLVKTHVFNGPHAFSCDMLLFCDIRAVYQQFLVMSSLILLQNIRIYLKSTYIYPGCIPMCSFLWYINARNTYHRFYLTLLILKH